VKSQAATKPVARRVGDRLSCIRHGHLWTEARMTIGDTELIRFECPRCGAIGSVRPGSASPPAEDHAERDQQ
jgi:hypothetical protein